MSLTELVNEQEIKDNRQIYGVVIGLVTNNQDPDGQGRIKIKFPWRGEEDESYWARIASFMAGNERGAVFYPEVDDEVLVAFEHGDINRPFLIGSLWNGQDKTPEENSDGKNNIRKIRSRSGHEIVFNDDKEEKKEKIEIHTNAGHKLVLDDTADEEKVEISTKGGHKLTLDDTSDKEKVEINSNAGHKLIFDDASGSEKIEIQSSAGHKIVFDDASGSEKIKIEDKSGSNSMTIDSAQSAISIESGMKLSIKAGQIEIKADSMLDIKAGGILTIEGSLVKLN